jgi:hypothetical protein
MEYLAEHSQRIICLRSAAAAVPPSSGHNNLLLRLNLAVHPAKTAPVWDGFRNLKHARVLDIGECNRPQSRAKVNRMRSSFNIAEEGGSVLSPAGDPPLGHDHNLHGVWYWEIHGAIGQ